MDGGELLCLIGPNGCGKSTLLNMMGGLILPSAGEVRVDGPVVTGPLPKKIATPPASAAIRHPC